MKKSEMTGAEKETYERFVKKTKPIIKEFQHWVIICSIAVFLVVLGIAIWYWILPRVAPITSFLIAAQLYALWGALLLALGAFSSPTTLALMSMTRLDGNPGLFAELMKVRFAANVGLLFLVVAFSIQAAVTLSTGWVIQ